MNDSEKDETPGASEREGWRWSSYVNDSEKEETPGASELEGWRWYDSGKNYLRVPLCDTRNGYK